MPSRDRRAGVRGRTGAGDGNPWMAGAVGGIDGQLLDVASLNADPSCRRPAPRRRLEDPAVGVGLVVDLVDAVRDAGDLDELRGQVPGVDVAPALADAHVLPDPDRKSTRLNSSHQIISYAVFCLKKKKNNQSTQPTHLILD